MGTLIGVGVGSYTGGGAAAIPDLIPSSPDFVAVAGAIGISKWEL